MPEDTRRLHEPVNVSRHASKITVHEEGDGRVRFKNIMLLAPGEWTDAGSHETLFYAPEAIKRSASNWVNRQTGEAVKKAPLNVRHDPMDPLKNVGHVDVTTVHADEDGRLYGDLVFHGRSDESRNAADLFKLALETNGEEGLGGVSVEIPSDIVEWDRERQMDKMVEMEFAGVGLVQYPASQEVAIERQADRIALARALAGEDDAGHVMVRANAMARAEDIATMSRELRETLDDLRESVRELQPPVEGGPEPPAPPAEGPPEEPAEEEGADVDFEAVNDLLSAYQESGGDLGQPVEQFVSWVAENREDEELAEASEAADAFRAETGNEAPTVGELQNWVTSNAEGEEPPEEPAAPANEPTVPAEAVQMQADILGDVIGVARELSEDVDRLRERVSDLEAQPSPRKTLAETDGDEFDVGITSEGVARTNDGYIGR